jgi:hypothetical protein
MRAARCQLSEASTFKHRIINGGRSHLLAGPAPLTS